MRVNVWIPDELASTVRERLPGVNVSGVLQEALRGLLGCQHRAAVCAACSTPIDLEEMRAAAVRAFALDVTDRLHGLMLGGTVEGAGRVVVEVAAAHGAPGITAPRPPRSARPRRERPAPPPTPITTRRTA